MADSILKVVQGWVRLLGNTDSTFIGNKSDRLKVDLEDMQKETYIVGSTEIAIGNNKSMLSLLNASGSTVVVKLRKLYLLNSQTSAVTGIISDFQLFRFTGHSGGTSLTPLTFDSNDSLNSSVTARTGGTISGEAAAALKRWEISSDEWGTGTLDQEGADHGSGLYGQPLYEHTSPFEKPITLRANEGIHLKHVVSSTAGAFDIYMIFTEEAA